MSPSQNPTKVKLSVYSVSQTEYSNVTVSSNFAGIPNLSKTRVSVAISFFASGNLPVVGRENLISAANSSFAYLISVGRLLSLAFSVVAKATVYDISLISGCFRRVSYCSIVTFLNPPWELPPTWRIVLSSMDARKLLETANKLQNSTVVSVIAIIAKIFLIFSLLKEVSATRLMVFLFFTLIIGITYYPSIFNSDNSVCHLCYFFIMCNHYDCLLKTLTGNLQ